MDNSEIKTLNQVQEAIFNFCMAMQKTFASVIPAIAKQMQIILKTCLRAYRAAGSPYGDSMEGMLRWFQEVGQAEELTRRAQEILANHKAMAMLRRHRN